MLIRILFISIMLAISTHSAPSPYFTRSFVRTPTSSFEQYLLVPDKSDAYRVPISHVHHYSDFQFPKQQVVYYNPTADNNQYSLNTLKRDDSLWQQMMMNLHSQSGENLLMNEESSVDKRSDMTDSESLKVIFDQDNMNSEMMEKLKREDLKKDNNMFEESASFATKVLLQPIVVAPENAANEQDIKENVGSLKMEDPQEEMNGDEIAKAVTAQIENSPQTEAIAESLMTRAIFPQQNSSQIIVEDNNQPMSISKNSEIASNVKPSEISTSTNGNLDNSNVNNFQEPSTERISKEMRLEIIKDAENSPEIIMRLVEIATERIEIVTRQDSDDFSEMKENEMAILSTTERVNKLTELDTSDEAMSTSQMPNEEDVLFTTDDSVRIITESNILDSTEMPRIEMISETNSLDVLAQSESDEMTLLDSTVQAKDDEIVSSSKKIIKNSVTDSDSLLKESSNKTQDEVEKIELSTETLRNEMITEENQSFMETESEEVSQSPDKTLSDELSMATTPESTESSRIVINSSTDVSISNESLGSSEPTITEDISTEQTAEKDSELILDQRSDFVAEENDPSVMNEKMSEQLVDDAVENLSIVTTERIGEEFVEQMLNDTVSESLATPRIDSSLELFTKAPFQTSESQEEVQSTTDIVQSELITNVSNLTEPTNTINEVSTNTINLPVTESTISMQFIETTQQSSTEALNLLQTVIVNDETRTGNEQISQEMNGKIVEDLEKSEIKSEPTFSNNDNKLNETEFSSSKDQTLNDSSERQSAEQIELRTEQNIESQNESAENVRESRVNKTPTIFLHNNRFYVISGVPEFYANFDAYQNPRTPIFSLQELQPIRPINNVAIQKIEPFRIYTENNEEQKLNTQNDNEPLKIQNDTRDSPPSDIENEKSMNVGQNESEERRDMTVKVKKREQDRQPVNEDNGGRRLRLFEDRILPLSAGRRLSLASRRSSTIERKFNSNDSNKKVDKYFHDPINTRIQQLQKRKEIAGRRNWRF